jgi:hypothetical protein
VSDIDDTLREELSALLDGALPAERAAELRRAIESDAALRKEYEELRRTVAAVRALPRPSAPAELRARLEKKLMAPPATGIRRLRFRLAIAAAVTVAVGAGVLALRPSGGDTVHEEARQPGPPEARDALRVTAMEAPARSGDPGQPVEMEEAEADGMAAGAAADVDDRARRSLRETPEAATAGEKEASLEKIAPAPRAKAKQDVKAEELARDEAMRLGGSRGGRKGDTRDAEQVTPATLLTFAARARVAPEARLSYLLQLNQLSATKVEAHLNQVQATWGPAYDIAATLPPTANLTVANRDEARQIFTVLHKFPGTAGRGMASAVGFAGNAGKAPLLTAELEVTPQQWQSVGTWLQLMNVPDRKSVKAREGRGAKKKARPDEDKEAAKPPLEPADRAAKRKVRIFIRYPQAVRPAAAPEKK